MIYHRIIMKLCDDIEQIRDSELPVSRFGVKINQSGLLRYAFNLCYLRDFQYNIEKQDTNLRTSKRHELMGLGQSLSFS